MTLTLAWFIIHYDCVITVLHVCNLAKFVLIQHDFCCDLSVFKGLYMRVS